MTEQAVVLTNEGYDKLVAELEQLKTVKRKEVAEKIKEARGFGDLSENAEYDEARKEQAEIELRITKVESILAKAEVVDVKKVSNRKVSVGSIVKVLDKEYNEEVEYHIVGATEADPFSDKISMESPIGQALLGHKTKDTVTVEVPDGEIELEILKISH